MNKQELQKLKKQVEETLAKVKKALSEAKTIRWQPKFNEIYFYVDDMGMIDYSFWGIEPDEIFRFNTGNCFKTEEEAEDYKENLLTKQALKDLALELNDGVEIDWEDKTQRKYNLFIDNLQPDIAYCWSNTTQGSDIYCLHDNYAKIAKDRIGEEKLIKLIKSGV